MKEIKQIRGFKFDGVIYEFEDDAVSAMRKNLFNEKLHRALNELCIYGEYRFDNIERLIEELGNEGLEIKLKG